MSGFPPARSQAWQVPSVGWPAKGNSRAGQKMRNLGRDPRCTVSFELPGTSGPGLANYAVLHCTAAITEGGAPELLQELAPRFLGPGVKFPPMDNPPAGRIAHLTVQRVTGNGPWVG